MVFLLPFPSGSSRHHEAKISVSCLCTTCNHHGALAPEPTIPSHQLDLARVFKILKNQARNNFLMILALVLDGAQNFLLSGGTCKNPCPGQLQVRKYCRKHGMVLCAWLANATAHCDLGVLDLQEGKHRNRRTDSVCPDVHGLTCQNLAIFKL